MLPYLPLPLLGTVNFVTVGNYFVSDQGIVGSIMMRHMILILVFSFAFRSVLPYEVYT
jgi:hypothetical protein